MMGKFLALTAFALTLLNIGVVSAADRPHGAVQCDQLKWSAAVLAANPDIALACQGVYERDGVLYAKATIEVVRVMANSLRFRTVLTNGSLGKRRSITLPSQWRVNLSGRDYPAAELTEGQRLDIFLPEDRFALTVLGSNEAETSDIERVED